MATQTDTKRAQWTKGTTLTTRLHTVAEAILSLASVHAAALTFLPQHLPLQGENGGLEELGDMAGLLSRRRRRVRKSERRYKDQVVWREWARRGGVEAAPELLQDERGEEETRLEEWI